jgi:hypothetical protein
LPRITASKHQHSNNNEKVKECHHRPIHWHLTRSLRKMAMRKKGETRTRDSTALFASRQNQSSSCILSPPTTTSPTSFSGAHQIDELFWCSSNRLKLLRKTGVLCVSAASPMVDRSVVAPTSNHCRLSLWLVTKSRRKDLLVCNFVMMIFLFHNAFDDHSFSAGWSCLSVPFFN